MKAILVDVAFMYRLIVPDDFDPENSQHLEDYVVPRVRGLLEDSLRGTIGENISGIEDDTECPFGILEEDQI